MKNLLYLSLLLWTAHGQLLFSGHCPIIPFMKDFQPEKFFGRWYEALRYPTILENGSKCNTVTIQKGISTTDVTLDLQMILSNSTTFTIKTHAYNVKVSDSDAWQIPIEQEQANDLVKIIDTDYKKYAIWWSCDDAAFYHIERLWILTKANKPSAKTLRNAKNVLKRLNLSSNVLTASNQNGCKY